MGTYYNMCIDVLTILVNEDVGYRPITAVGLKKKMSTPFSLVIIRVVGAIVKISEIYVNRLKD